jgi:hypothetical protein
MKLFTFLGFLLINFGMNIVAYGQSKTDASADSGPRKVVTGASLTQLYATPMPADKRIMVQTKPMAPKQVANPNVRATGLAVSTGKKVPSTVVIAQPVLVSDTLKP